jgi:nucleoside 2-deoxyribosyltransferase
VPRVYLAGPPFADEYRRRAEQLVRELGWEPIDPMRRDFRGRTEGHEEEIVNGDFSEPDDGTAMEAWYAHSRGKPVVAYTAGRKPHPWAVFVAAAVRDELDQAVSALSEPRG